MKRARILKNLVLAAAIVATTIPAASAGSNRVGRRLDAITSGRIYDRILTPQMNPGYFFSDKRAEKDFLDDVRSGRMSLDRVPEGQRQYFQLQLDLGR